MIIAVWRDGDVTYADGRIVIEPPSRIAEKLAGRPLKAVGAVDRLEAGVPVIERVQTVVKPGTPEHFRAMVLKLPDARVLLDDGD